MADQRPIGIFDSGVGGVSVLREIRALLPHEDVIYCADSGHAPYGEKSQALIQARSTELTEFLLAQGAKAIVVACNTATAAAASSLRQRWPTVPMIGMEPAVKPAAAATKQGIVGVLATVGTLASSRFAALLDNFGRGVDVVTEPGIGLVECIERGELDSYSTRELLAAHLQPLIDAGADVIVLGCTHYVFLRSMVESIVGPSVAVIDTGAAVAQHLKRRLGEAGLLADTCNEERNDRGHEVFWTSGQVSVVSKTLSHLWRDDVSVLVLPPARSLP